LVMSLSNVSECRKDVVLLIATAILCAVLILLTVLSAWSMVAPVVSWIAESAKRLLAGVPSGLASLRSCVYEAYQLFPSVSWFLDSLIALIGIGAPVVVVVACYELARSRRR